MKKFFRLGKRMLALFIVVLLNINSYAAVSANDGSAFVTKAEFDALVNTFNEQMDSYQAGLNSKIDGAIANYLAGLSSVKIANLDNICYTDSTDGILSVISYDNIQWVDGIMAMSMSYVLTSTWRSNNKAVTYGALLNAQNKTNTEFWEIGLKELNTNRNLGVWDGHCETWQSLSMVGKNTTSNPQYATSGSYLTLNPNSWQMPINSRKFIPDILSGGAVIFNFGSAGASTSTVGNSFLIYSHDCVPKREIRKRHQKKIINVKKGQSFKLFSDFDNIVDFANDTDNLGVHTNITGLADVMGGSSSTYWYNGGTGEGDTWSFTHKMGDKWNSSVSADKKVRPYFGFIQTLQDWDKVLIEDYDNYISDMKKYQSNIKTDKTKNDGNEHLYVSSGSPIALVDKDAVVTIPIEFTEKNKDFDVWVKVGAFDILKEITADNKDYILYDQVKIKNKKDEGSFLDSREGSAKYSIRIENGYGELKFQMPKKGYIFLKWSYSGNDALGGGTYLPTKTIQVQTE